jgi:hypothetical protein
MKRAHEERASDYADLMNAYWELTDARAPADMPELGQVQIATEMVAGSRTNVFDDEDHGLMYKLLGDEGNFRKKAKELEDSIAAAEWALPRLQTALVTLRERRPDQFRRLNLASADLFSIGFEDFDLTAADPISDGTPFSCRHCGEPDVPAGSRYCPTCGEPNPLP